MANDPVDIDLRFPDAGPSELRIIVGPCRIRITPGAGKPWVAGRYEDPTGLLPLRVSRDGGMATLAQAANAVMPASVTRPPSLELRLGTGRPYQLTVEGGANETVADLGGLPLTRLLLRYGAGRADIDFSAPNPAQMAGLDIAAGGAAMHLQNLANANLAEMTVSGGAAQYRLDFGGELRRDAEVRLNTGVAAIDLTVPDANATVVRAGSVLGALEVGDGFTTREGSYWNQAAVAGGSPSLRITITSVLGAVKVRRA